MPVDKQPRSAAPRRAVVLLAATVAAFSSATGVVLAQTGGTVAPSSPEVSSITCVTRCIKPSVGTVGSKIRITGTDLDTTRVVSLPKSDGKRAKDTTPVIKSSEAVVSVIQPGAVTGALRIADTNGQVHDYNDVPFTVGTEAQLQAAQNTYRFPVRGKHDYGGAGSRFGAPRAGHTHQGQDVSAACGTKLVAARGGRVQYAGYHSAAGNYIVIDGYKDSFDYAYMHLTAPARFKTGQRVSTGEQIGKVGDSGDAVGCHLHFEIWKKPGWYEGGAPKDPLPTLKYWDSYS